MRTPEGGLVGLRRDGQRHYFVTDPKGSVYGVTDAAGAFVAKYDYDPDGNPTYWGHPNTLEQQWRFTGARRDVDLFASAELYKLGIRSYQPGHGRWTQPDPPGNPLQPSQMNRYAYVGCDPVNNTDPTGASVGCALSTLLNPFADVSPETYIIAGIGGDVAFTGASVAALGGTAVWAGLPLAAAGLFLVGYAVAQECY